MGIFDTALDKRFTESPELALANVDGVDVLLIHNAADGLVYKIQASVLASFINAAVSQADILDALNAPNGVATLDSGGKVPAAQLPAYVDDVLEYATASAFPATGEGGKIYVALDTNLTYRWSGSAYVEISASLALGETSSTAYRGDRGKTAYDHSQATGNPHGTSKADVGLGNVDNTSDANKPVSTAQQTALNAKANKAGDTFTGPVVVNYDAPLFTAWNASATSWGGYEWKQGTSLDAEFKQHAASGELRLSTGRNSSWGGSFTLYVDTVKVWHIRPTTITLQTGVKLGLGITPSQLLDVNEDSIRVRTAKTPASASAAGDAGQIAWDANYVYVCVASNTWKRSALSIW